MTSRPMARLGVAVFVLTFAAIISEVVHRVYATMVGVGLGRIVVLCYHSSSLYQIH